MPREHTAAVILAAGKGTRMHSDRPKVLQTLLGETMLGCVARAAAGAAAHVITVVGFGADEVARSHPELKDGFVLQAEQKGTGHALQVAWEAVRASGATHCLVLNGDTPLVGPDALQELLDSAADGADLAFLTAVLPEAGAFGRVIRGADGRAAGIVEAKDFDPARHGADTGEVNTGLFCLSVNAIENILFSLTSANRAGEYYITDLVGLAAAEGMKVEALRREDGADLLGINSPAELAAAEERLRARIVADLLASGVILHHPQLVVAGPRAVIEPGAELFGPCRVLGASRVACGARVCAFSCLTDSVVGAGATVRESSHLTEARLQAGSDCGPFARLRPGAELKERAHVGNFVEMKKAVLGEGAKAGHLTYLGDTEVGPGANIGAGTITCNYDGQNKHKTAIGARAFIGSNTALVAPVRVGDEAVIGAGSVITKDVPEAHLGVGRARQANIPWRGRKP